MYVSLTYMYTVVYRQSPPPHLFTSLPHERIYIMNVPPLVYRPRPPFSKVFTWRCSYISLLNCRFLKLEGTNNRSLETDVILYQHSWHDRRCPVGITVIFHQWRGSVNVMPPHNTAYRPAALHGHHLHPIEAPRRILDQG